MNNLAIAATLAATVVVAAAFAEPTTELTPPTPAVSSASPAQGAEFVERQARGLWRAPKLVGVAVYDSNDRKIGRVKDVLIDHDGGAELVVIGLGGVFGFATKDVAVPFRALIWRMESRRVATASSSGGDPPTLGGADLAASEASHGYPDMAKIGLSQEQLGSAPAFRYARELPPGNDGKN